MAEHKKTTSRDIVCNGKEYRVINIPCGGGRPHVEVLNLYAIIVAHDINYSEIRRAPVSKMPVIKGTNHTDFEKWEYVR